MIVRGKQQTPLTALCAPRKKFSYFLDTLEYCTSMHGGNIEYTMARSVHPEPAGGSK